MRFGTDSAMTPLSRCSQRIRHLRRDAPPLNSMRRIFPLMVFGSEKLDLARGYL
jgi:hypothetical protein